MPETFIIVKYAFLCPNSRKLDIAQNQSLTSDSTSSRSPTFTPVPMCCSYWPICPPFCGPVPDGRLQRIIAQSTLSNVLWLIGHSRQRPIILWPTV